MNVYILSLFLCISCSSKKKEESKTTVSTTTSTQEDSDCPPGVKIDCNVPTMTQEEITAIQEKNKATELIHVEFDKEIAKKELEKINGVSRVKSIDKTSWLIESSSSNDLRSTIAKFAAKKELLILTLKKEEDKLEDIFKKLTNLLFLNSLYFLHLRSIQVD